MKLKVAIVVALIGLAIGVLVITRDSTPAFNDPSLVPTTKSVFSFPSSPSLKTRLWLTWFKLRKKLLGPNPGTYTLGPRPTQRCSIHGLLNQCMEMSDVRYWIDKNVAAGSVNFGHTNTLNGTQWIAAFESALQTGQPEWYVSESNRFRKENLVLIRYDSKTVLVLPMERASQYRKAFPPLK